MIQYALYARLEAQPGKEETVAGFLATALDMANREATTPIWFALRLAPSTFGIFDAFASEADRNAHLNGPIGQALMTHAGELLVAPPSIELLEVLAMKNPTSAL